MAAKQILLEWPSSAEHQAQHSQHHVLPLHSEKIWCFPFRQYFLKHSFDSFRKSKITLCTSCPCLDVQFEAFLFVSSNIAQTFLSSSRFLGTCQQTGNASRSCSLLKGFPSSYLWLFSNSQRTVNVSNWGTAQPDNRRICGSFCSWHARRQHIRHCNSFFLMVELDSERLRKL